MALYEVIIISSIISINIIIILTLILVLVLILILILILTIVRVSGGLLQTLHSPMPGEAQLGADRTANYAGA